MEEKKKLIRFVDAGYNDKFTVADGDEVTIFYADFAMTRACKYIDDYHFMFGSTCYHICEFAERMVKNNGVVVPVQKL